MAPENTRLGRIQREMEKFTRKEVEHYIVEGEPRVSPEMTGYAVKCYGCGLVHLSKSEYLRQMLNADAGWECPQCKRLAEFDDETYFEWQEKHGEEEETE